MIIFFLFNCELPMLVTNEVIKMEMNILFDEIK